MRILPPTSAAPGCHPAEKQDQRSGFRNDRKLNAGQPAEIVTADTFHTHADDVSATDCKTGVVQAYSVDSPTICLETCRSDEGVEHEPLISRAILAEVPLTGQSLCSRDRGVHDLRWGRQRR